MHNAENIYKILLDGQWSLRDFTEFTRLYYQNYSFIYCLDTEANFEANDHLRDVLSEYQLRSGATYVSIYSIFQHQIPKEDRPIVKSIAYASPGWLELLLNSDVAVEVAKTVSIYLGAHTIVMTAYKRLSEIYGQLRQKRKARRNASIKLDKDQIVEIQRLNRELAKGLGFKSLKALDEHTNDPEESSKLLMAHFRVLRGF